MKIISLINQKGGVAKTTSTLSLASALSKLQKKVLVIDIDPQGNATTGAGIDKTELKATTFDLLLRSNPIEECITNNGVYDIVGTTIELASAEYEMFNRFLRESLLRKKLQDKKNYDFILIDCPPSLSLLTINALVASNEVLIPVAPEPFALEGISQLINTIIKIREINENLEIKSVFITKFDQRKKTNIEIKEGLEKMFKDKLSKTIIRISSDIEKGQFINKDIYEYNPKCNAAIDYMNLAKELI
ncbi:MAG: ParA family protein [Cetobacterium sp.]|uniref:ParA family protein n=1 Tax=unclassified Cetobacterium TaxID=2630983 RepID=UPI0006484F43|nr:AAA family ATPase [Cetobacterium sp. ZWU0022]